MRLDSTPKMEIRIGVSYTRYFMRSVCISSLWIWIYPVYGYGYGYIQSMDISPYLAPDV